MRPGVRHPLSPVSEQQRLPSAGTGPSHRPGGEQGGDRHNDRFPGVYAGYPWLNTLGYGFPVAYGGPYTDDQEEMSGPQPAPQPADYGNNAPPPDYTQEAPPQLAANAGPAFRPPYQGQTDAPPLHAQPATTLIFKDGRPSLQVHNYALTSSTLYALDGESHQEIPLSLLNVPATVEANRTSGVDFALPVSR
jgi:hypothetical protein